jgi:serine/threonine-protein phosphatase PPG1
MLSNHFTVSYIDNNSNNNASIGSHIDSVSYNPSVSVGSDFDVYLSELSSYRLLPPAVIQFLCTKISELWQQDKNVLSLSSPQTLVGDVHGQYSDVLEMFHISGPVPHTNYLFLGDYVDRGPQSILTITLLIVLKLRYPNRIHLIRGNHECRSISRTYGFYAECMAKYPEDSKVWSYFCDAFDYMPLAALIDNHIFCAHGGLSPTFNLISQLSMIDRVSEIPFEGAMCDLIWGDPEADQQGFQLSTRGAGYIFGRDIVEKFLYINNLNFFMRAHQLCHEGYQILW